MTTQVVARLDPELRTDVEVDPVCERPVSLQEFEQDDLIIDYAGRLYAFCGVGCRTTFLADPARFAVAGRDLP